MEHRIAGTVTAEDLFGAFRTTGETERDEALESVRDLRLTPEQAINPDNIFMLRRMQWAALRDKVGFGHDNDQIKTDFIVDGGEADQIGEQYLEAVGVADDDPNRAHYLDLIKSAKIDPFSSDGEQWSFNPDFGPRVEYTNRYTEALENLEGGENEERAELVEELNTARDKLATISAKRERRFATFGKTRQKYEEALQDYNDKVCELGRHELAQFEHDNPDATDVEKQIWFVEFIKEQQVATREAKIQKLENSLNGRIVKFLATGSLPKRILKSAGVGIGLGVVASAAGLAAGAVGFGAVVAGTVAGAGVVSTRAAKFFASARGRKEGSATAQVDHIDSEKVRTDASRTAGGDLLAQLTRETNEYIGRDIEKTQRGACKDAAIAVGVTAVSFAAGKLGADLIMEHTAWGQNASEALANVREHLPWSKQPAEVHTMSDIADHVVAEPQPPAPAPAELPPGGLAADTDTMANALKDALGGNNSTVIDHVIDNADVMTIGRGEGWFQTFQEMGIPQKDWYQLLHEVGPKLHEQGIAYKMGNLWGISHSGAMPKEAVETIVNTAKDSGIHVG